MVGMIKAAPIGSLRLEEGREDGGDGGDEGDGGVGGVEEGKGDEEQVI